MTMRIDLNNIIASQVNTDKKAAKAPATPEVVQSEDKATLSADAVAVQSLSSQVLQMPAIRQSSVESLRNQVQDGNYEVEPDKIADAMIDEYLK